MATKKQKRLAAQDCRERFLDEIAAAVLAGASA